MNYSSALFTLLAIIATSSASQAQTNQTKFEKKQIKIQKRNKRQERNEALKDTATTIKTNPQTANNVPTTSPSYTPTQWPTWFPTTDQTKAPVTRKPTRPPRTPRPTKHPTPIPTTLNNTPQLNQNALVIAVDDTISLQSGTTEAFIAVLENDTGSNLIVRAITSQPTNGQCSISLNLSEVVYIPNDTNFVGSDQCTYETCDDEEDCDTAIVRITIGSGVNPTPPTPTPPAPTPPTGCDLGTIVDVAEKNGFDTLVAAVEAAGLVDILNGDGPFTVFGTLFMFRF